MVMIITFHFNHFEQFVALRVNDAWWKGSQSLIKKPIAKGAMYGLDNGFI